MIDALEMLLKAERSRIIGYVRVAVLLVMLLDLDTVVGTACAVVESNVSVTGTDLWCYTCKENYAKVYDYRNAPCKNNISEIAIAQCGERDTYCKIERKVLHRKVLYIERGCAETCYYGCKYQGFGLTYETCYSCCRFPSCNGHAGSDVLKPLHLLSVICLLVFYLSF